MTKPQPISVTEAAKHLGVSTVQVREWCREGTLAAIKLGRTWAIDRQVMLDWKAFRAKYGKRKDKRS